MKKNIAAWLLFMIFIILSTAKASDQPKAPPQKQKDTKHINFDMVERVGYQFDPGSNNDTYFTVVGPEENKNTGFRVINMDLSNPLQKAVIESCERLALLAQNTPQKIKFQVVGRMSTDFNNIIDFSEGDLLYCEAKGK